MEDPPPSMPRSYKIGLWPRRKPDASNARSQNAREVLRVATDLAQQVAASVRRRRIPLILGGDCTVTIGLVARHSRAGTPPALVCVDGGPDLYTPDTRANGNLNAMGLAHMLALPGSVPPLRLLARSFRC